MQKLIQLIDFIVQHDEAAWAFIKAVLTDLGVGGGDPTAEPNPVLKAQASEQYAAQAAALNLDWAKLLPLILEIVSLFKK